MGRFGRDARRAAASIETDLWELFATNGGKVSDKVKNCLLFCAEALSSRRLDPVCILEIGVQDGAVLQFWSRYCPNAEHIVGCAADPAAAALNFADDRISVISGDLSAPETLEKIGAVAIDFDIIVDHGSDPTGDVERRFALYFPMLRNDGYFIAGDDRPAPLEAAPDGMERASSAMSFFRRLPDLMSSRVRDRSDQMLAARMSEPTLATATLDEIVEVRFRGSLCLMIKGPGAESNRLQPAGVPAEPLSMPEPKLSDPTFMPSSVRLGHTGAGVPGRLTETTDHGPNEDTGAQRVVRRRKMLQETVAGEDEDGASPKLEDDKIPAALWAGRQQILAAPDSEIAARCNLRMASISALIARHQVISFDVFDTLLCRRVAEPKDVFRLIEERHGLTDFVATRIKAEQMARQRFATSASPEVTIFEIYQVLSELRPDIQLAAQHEVDVEAELLYADPMVARIVEAARAQQKRVIAVSDMYLNAVQIAGLLERAGLSIDKVYSSADHRDEGYGKFNGKMYGFVAREEGVELKEILHFGDNRISDVRNALSSGVSGVHVNARRDCVRDAGAPFMPVGIKGENVTEALMLGQIHARLPHLNVGTSRLYSYGYSAAGPLMLGFCRFIAARATKDKIERIALVARDGYIIEKALDILRLDVPSYGVMPFSRRMSIFPALRKNSAVVEKVLLRQLNKRGTPQQFCNLLGLDPAILGNAADGRPEMDAIDFIQTFRAQLEAEADAECELLVRHAQEWMGADAKKAALVDVGWGLSGVRALDKIIEPEYSGYFCGIRHDGYRRPGMHGYLFEYGEPVKVARAIMPMVDIIELVFSDPRPAFAKLSLNGDEIVPQSERLSSSEVTRGAAIEDVHHGVLDFLRDIRDVQHLMNDDDLCGFNRKAMARLLTSPTADEFESLAPIPHSRDVGHQDWGPIGDYWGGKVLVAARGPGGAGTRSMTMTHRLRLRARKTAKSIVSFAHLEGLSYWVIGLNSRYRTWRGIH